MSMLGGMMPPVVVEVLASTAEFQAKMAEVKGELAGLEAQSAGVMGKMTAIGKVATVSMGVAAVGIAAIGTKMASDLQTGLTGLVTGAGESAKNIDLIRQGVLKMADETGAGATDLVNGLYMIESAGYHGADALAVLEASAKGAAVGMADQEDVANAVTSALNAYGLKGKDAAGVTNQLIATVKSGKMHMQDLATSLGTVLPTAASLHVPLSQVGAAMATMTSQGVGAAQASTALRMMMGSLVNPSSTAADAMKKVGLSTKLVGDTLEKQGIPATMQLIQNAMDRSGLKGSEYTATFMDMVGGVRSGQAALLLSGKHLDTLSQNWNNVARAGAKGGDQIAGWNKVTKDLGTQTKMLVEVIKGLLIEVGNKMLPIITTIVSHIREWIEYSKEHTEVVKMVAGAIGAVLLPFIAAYIISMISAAAATIAATWPILAILAALAALGAGLVYAYDHWAWFREGVKTAIAVIKAVIGQLIAWWKQAWPTIWATIKTVWGYIKAYVIMVIHIVKDVVGAVMDAFHGDWSSAWAKVKDIFAQVWSFLKEHAGPAMLAVGRAIVNGLKGLAKLLLEVGKDAMQGLIDGIKSMIGDAVQAAQDAGGAVVDGIKGVLHIGSPSKVMFEVGKNTSQGLIDGLKSMSAKVSEASRDQAAKVVDAALQQVDAMQQRVAAKIQATQQAIASNASTIAQSLGAAGNLSSIQAQQDQYGNAERLTGGYLVNQVQDQVAQAKKFGAHLRQLMDAGLNGTTLQQIVGMGPAAGDAYAIALLANVKNIKSLNRAEKQLSGYEQRTSHALSSSQGLYGNLHQEQQNMKALQSAAKALHEAARDIKHTKNDKATIDLTVRIDGKAVHRNQIKHAQRYKQRNGTTGLS